MRKFSIPYNGVSAEAYISAVTPYMDYIDSIFLGFPSLLDSHPQYQNIKIKEAAELNGLDFLSKQIPCKRFLTLNRTHYHKSDQELQDFCENTVFPLIDKYHIEGLIMTDFNMAKFVHKQRPDVDISTSCNTFMNNIRTMHLWHEQCGTTLFNPPRDICRTLDALKKLSAEGFQLKCIVNESCRYGCPQQMIHCFDSVKLNGPYDFECSHISDEEILKCNWILPRWLKYLDPYVAIYKIVGRGASLGRIISMLDAYINERDNIYLDDFLYGGAYRGKHLNLPTKMIPDKLLTCECKNCKHCNLCNHIIQDYYQYVKNS